MYTVCMVIHDVADSEVTNSSIDEEVEYSDDAESDSSEYTGV